MTLKFWLIFVINFDLNQKSFLIKYIYNFSMGKKLKNNLYQFIKIISNRTFRFSFFVTVW